MSAFKDSASGTPSDHSSRDIRATREVSYVAEEHRVVINRDAFTSIEMTIRDRQLFLAIAAGCFGISINPMIEKGIEYFANDDPVSGVVAAVSAPFFIFGCLFGALYYLKRQNYKQAVDGIFDETKIVSDKTIITTGDGTVTVTDNLN